jgi:hypothetical protein
VSDLPEEPLLEELPQADLERLLGQLKEEEEHAQRARLSSVESLKAWVAKHPTLQQTTLMESIALYGPAFLELLRRALGL